MPLEPSHWLLTIALALSWTASQCQSISVPRERFVQWGANRALVDTLYDEAAGDYLKCRESLLDTKMDLDTCIAISKRQIEREGQYAHELGACQEENADLGDKVKRLRVWAWISKAALAVGAVFAVKKLVDTAKP